MQESGDLQFKVADFGGDLQRQARFDGDVVGELGVVDLFLPQGERLRGGFQQRGGVILAQAPWE